MVWGTRSVRTRSLVAWTMAVSIGVWHCASNRAPAVPRAQTGVQTSGANAAEVGHVDLKPTEHESRTADVHVETRPSVASPCAENMVLVELRSKRFCIDAYEAAVVEVS